MPHNKPIAQLVVFIAVTALLPRLAPAAPDAPGASTAPAPPATTKAATQPALLAVGTGRDDGDGSPRLWVVISQPPEKADEPFTTRVLTRQAWAAPTWEAFRSLSGRPISVTRDPTGLVMLFDDGRPARYSSSDFRTYSRLPSGVEALSLGGDSQSLWALGIADAAEASATQASTVPTTAPAEPPRLGLYHQDREGWVARGAWPQSRSPARPWRTTLCIISGQPHAAVLLDDGAIEVSRYANDAWQTLAVIASPGEVRAMHLMDDGLRPVLWTNPGHGAGRLWVLGDEVRPIDLPLEGDSAGGSEVALALGGDQYRLFFVRGDKVFEQRYLLDGEPSGKPVEVEVPRATVATGPMNLLTLLAMALLMFVLLSALRKQRRSPRRAALPAGLVIAPLPHRLAAGFVDALPLLAGIAVALWRVDPRQPEALLDDAIARWAMILGAIAYLGHTLMIELYFGRSVGKMLLGLRVLGIDGQPPTMQALAIRNAMRIIDIPLPNLPYGPLVDLLLLIYSPIRQRLGDMAAGTVVVKPGEAPAPAADQTED